jgi:hypothetical protein
MDSNREPPRGSLTNTGIAPGPADVDVAALRTETDWRTSADHFCELCDCFKSGWADMPNMTAEWCEDLTCPCHEAEPIDAP